jgi:hypothetical protein
VEEAMGARNPFRTAAQESHCWFAVDRVARDPVSTEWKRRARLRQARWRAAQGYPIGAHPYAGGDGATPVGSRLALEFARSTGANFMTPAALAAARKRLANPEPHEMLAADRLWADLLSSMPLCFNLFGDLEGDRPRAGAAVRAWWPAAPAGDVTVRFEHSPGRRDPDYLFNRSAFDVAFDIDPGNGARGIIGVETKYHEHARPEPIPRLEALQRYLDVSARSGQFVDGFKTWLVGTELQQIWQDHLLALAMQQHPSGRWTWVRFVLVYPADNTSFARAAAAYRRVLRSDETFEARTIEELISTPGAIAPETRRAIVARYLEDQRR